MAVLHAGTAKGVLLITAMIPAENHAARSKSNFAKGPGRDYPRGWSAVSVELGMLRTLGSIVELYYCPIWSPPACSSSNAKLLKSIPSSPLIKLSKSKLSSTSVPSMGPKSMRLS